MEFLKANYLNTTTMISVDSNSSLISNLFTRDKYRQYYSNGYNSDSLSTAIVVTFDETTTLSRIALIDTNFKDFYIFYNGSTASTLSLQNADTTTASYTNNADENKYFRFSTINASSITIVANKTIVANDEKLLGLLYLGDTNVVLEKIPSASKYKPKLNPKQIVHTLSDGGTRIHTVRQKWDVSLQLEYVSQAQKDSLFDLYDAASEFNFCPFGTATSWDAIFFEAVWTGPFDFYEYADNAASAGYKGKITLKETPT